MNTPFLLCWLLAFFPHFGNSQVDCKVKKEMMKPLIRNYSPYFYRLSWNDKNKTETAILDKDSELTISQSGCDRHHTAFVFKFPEMNEELPEGYWPGQLFLWLDRVFEYNTDWVLFRVEFRKQLLRYYQNGEDPGQTFNFPVLERNFFYYDTRNQGKMEIHLEIVQYIYNDKIKKPGVEEDVYD